MKRLTTHPILAVTLWLAVAAPAAVLGRNTNPAIAPPNSNPHGQSYAAWSAAWWQWSMQLPLTGHPLLDTPEFDMEAGQSGDVWFLGAPFGTVQRTSYVPEGKALFFALLNAEASDLEGLGATATEQLETAQFLANHIDSLFCTLDGVSVQNLQNYRVSSPQFAFTAPTPWIFGDTGGAGTSVGDGYYLFLNPLSKGQHTLHYGGSFHFAVAEGDPFDFDGAIDMTYNIIVGKPPQIIPTTETYKGKGYGQWAALWQKWAIALPLEGHPFLDTPEFNVRDGQRGEVWFLAAPFDSVTRTCTIPAGKALFFPLGNAECSNREDPPFFGATEADQQACANFLVNHLTDLFCTIDGDPVDNLADYRVASPQYKFIAPDPNILGVAGGGKGTSVTDGYWIMLKPLARGAHTLHFGGLFHFAVADGDPFDADLPIDMTYLLQVR